MSCHVGVKHQDLYRYPTIEYALVELVLDCGHVTTQDAAFHPGRAQDLPRRPRRRVRVLCQSCDPLPQRHPPPGGPSNTALNADGERYLTRMGVQAVGQVRRYRSWRYDSITFWKAYACGCEFHHQSPSHYSPRACAAHRRHLIPREAA